MACILWDGFYINGIDCIHWDGVKFNRMLCSSSLNEMVCSTVGWCVVQFRWLLGQWDGLYSLFSGMACRSIGWRVDQWDGV